MQIGCISMYLLMVITNGYGYGWLMVITVCVCVRTALIGVHVRM